MKMLCYLFLFFVSFQVMASKVIFFKGNVLVNDQPAKKGMKLSEGDIVKANKKSFAVLQIGKADKLKLNEESTIKIEAVRRPQKKRPHLTKIYLKVGSVFSKVVNEGDKPRNFRLRTKSVSMGVRGTEFFTAYGKGKDQWMCVREGKVLVRSKKGRTLVKEGEGIFIIGGQKITEPKPYEWTKNLNWKFEGKKLENNLDINSAYNDFEDQDYD